MIHTHLFLGSIPFGLQVQINLKFFKNKIYFIFMLFINRFLLPYFFF